jgi:hypothetical protein
MKILVSGRLCAVVLSLALCPLSLSLAPQARAQVVTTPGGPTPVVNQGFDPIALYLTWHKDPTTTMTVRWQTLVGATPATIVTRVEYRKLESDTWLSHNAVAIPMPHSNRITHEAELVGLEPGATYQFRFGLGAKVYSFRTMPTQPDRPVRFATGGDTMHNKMWWLKTNREVLKHDPDFVLLGGDLCYEDGRAAGVNRVYDWLDGAKETLISSDNRVVPILAAIGNHEVDGAYGQPAEHAPFYHHLFPFPGKQGYNVLDFGNYMSLVLLDSGHTNPVGGAQAKWLGETLQNRRDVPHVFPIYHVPAYPSVRSYEEPISQQVRQHWTPLFDRLGVRVAFENHDHAYKRTRPLFANKVDYTRGVTYIGDGAWGVGTRKVHPESWYLAKAIEERHFILVTLHGRSQHFEAIDENGILIDQFPEASLIPMAKTQTATVANIAPVPTK